MYEETFFQSEKKQTEREDEHSTNVIKSKIHKVIIIIEYHAYTYTYMYMYCISNLKSNQVNTV